MRDPISGLGGAVVAMIRMIDVVAGLSKPSAWLSRCGLKNGVSFPVEVTVPTVFVGFHGAVVVKLSGAVAPWSVNLLMMNTRQFPIGTKFVI
jgi:hypothetical protein